MIAKRRTRTANSIPHWEILATVRKCGSMASASRKLGVHVNTVSRRMRRIRRFFANESVDEQWANFFRDHNSVTLRNQLIVRHRPIAHAVFRSFKKGLPSVIDRNSLASAADAGLMEAVERFDIIQGMQFKPYARRIIRGRMLDDLRRQDPASRHARRQQKQVAAARDELEQQLGRESTDHELAERLGCGESDILIERIAREFGIIQDDDERNATAALPGRPVVSTRERLGRIAELCKGLDFCDQMVLALRFCHKQTYSEIGDLLDLSESRCLQITTAAVEHIRRTHTRAEVAKELELVS